MTKVISYSLWGGLEQGRYKRSFARNYRNWERSLSDRELWVYHDDSIPATFRNSYPKARWIEMPKGHYYEGAYWRYLAIDEADDVWMRDVDMPLNMEVNQLLDDTWQRSGMRLGIYRLYTIPAHKPWSRRLIAGGCWNIKGCMNGEMGEMITDYCRQYWHYPYGSDEYFLGRRVMSRFKDDCAVFVDRFADDVAGFVFDNTMYVPLPQSGYNYERMVNPTYGRRGLLVWIAKLKHYLDFLRERAGRVCSVLLTGSGRIRYTRFSSALGQPRKLRLFYLLHNMALKLRARFAFNLGAGDPRLCAPLVVAMHGSEDSLKNLRTSLYSVLRQCPLDTRLVLYVPHTIGEQAQTVAAGLANAALVEIQPVKKGHSRQNTIAHALSANKKAVCVYSEAAVAYPPNWLSELCETWYRYPQHVCLRSARNLIYGKEIAIDSIVPHLSAGVLFPPATVIDDKDDADDDMWLRLVLNAGKHSRMLSPYLPDWPNFLR